MTTTTHTTSLLRRVALALACLLAVALVAAGGARAEFGLVEDSFRATVVNERGDVEERAGITPYAAVTSFSFRETTGGWPILPDGNVKQIDVELPPGFIGNPRDLPKCTGAQFADVDPTTFNPRCPDETAVGIANNVLNVGFGLPVDAPVYNLVPPAGAPAAFGFTAMGVPVKVVASVRPSDHGLTMKIRGISSAAPVHSSSLTFWGVPSDSRHDAERGMCAVTFEDPDDPWFPQPHDLCPVRLPAQKFLANPLNCDSGPLRTTFRARSWQEPDREIVATADTDRAPVDCDRLNFKPAIEVVPDTRQAGAPAGYEVAITVPQGDDPVGAATADPYDDAVTSQLKDAVVTLPEGTSVSPPSSDGLAACTPAQIGLGSDADPACPAASKIGEVTIENPLMEQPLRGGIFLAKPTDEQLLAIYLVAQGSGVTLKLPGKIAADPVTGRLTTRFTDNPQLPFSKLSLRFKGGPRAPLANPRTCGPATTTGSFTPWSGGDAATASSTFQIEGCGDPGRFAPTLVAGTSDPTAGASSPFVLRLARTDADQQLAQLSRVTMPAGLVGNVGSVPLCPEAAAATGTCGAESRIGRAVVGSGAGASPKQIEGGTVSLTAGYKGGDFGLSIAVPAVAGPFDLGTVVVRSAIHVNNDASLTIDTDPLPTILKGIPLQIRSIDLAMDRPGFMVNPTNCSPLEIRATALSTTGTSADAVAPFRVGDCAALPFAPKITASVSAGASDSAVLHVRVAQSPQQAHARTITVALPDSLSARLTSIQNACTPAQYAADACPARTKVGEAQAVTPILNQPLSGPVWMVREGTRIPMLWVRLGGQVDIELRGTVVITRKQTITSTFDNIPDVALTSFDLRLAGGENSALERVTPLCASDLSMPTVSIGQNGKRSTATTIIAADGCKLTARAGARGAAVVVRANAPAAGRLVLSGTGLKGVSRTVSRSGAVTFTLPLTKAARTTLATRGTLRTAVKVGFTARDGGAKSTVTAKATVKAPKQKG